MNPKLFAIAARLHSLHSAQGRLVARIESLRSQEEGESQKHGRVTNATPTKSKPLTIKGATVSKREFISDAQSTRDELASQRAYFRLWDALADVEPSYPSSLLSDYDTECRRLAAERETQESMAQGARDASTSKRNGNGSKVPALTA